MSRFFVNPLRSIVSILSTDYLKIEEKLERVTKAETHRSRPF